MVPHLSLRVKLTLGYALVFALTVLLGGSGVYLATRGVLSASLDASLHQTASVAQGSIEQDGSQTRFTPELQPSSDLSIELLNASGAVIAVSGDREDLMDVNRSRSLQVGLRTQGDRRVLLTRVPGGVYLRISRSTEFLSEFLEALARMLVAAGSLMIAAACAAGYGLAHRALRPVDAVARTARSIASRGDYAQRVPPAPGQDEMARLTGTVNDMLDRLSSTIEREKQFARIAAHELRTPLTALKGRLELTLERPRSAVEYARALVSMQERVEALTSLTERLLALARTDAPAQLEPVELSAAALKVSEGWEEAFAAQHKVITLDVEETWVQAEPDGVERVISNLLENALKYGEGTRVALRVRSGTVTVENPGRGPDQAAWERMLQPFERGAGVQGVSGSGLGLTLVSALTRRWNAHLVPEWDGDAFRISVQFPDGAP